MNEVYFLSVTCEESFFLYIALSIEHLYPLHARPKVCHAHVTVRHEQYINMTLVEFYST